MKLHEGEVLLQSQLGIGTRVILRWPVNDEPEKCETLQDRLKSQPSGTRSKIVVVDDERVCADLMVDVLTSDHEVQVFYGGQAAIDYLKRESFDLVLTDLRMPDISGIGVYEWVRKNLPGREKDVVFVTGNAFEPEYQEFIRSLDNVVIAKPFNLRTFLGLVQLALQQGK